MRAHLRCRVIALALVLCSGFTLIGMRLVSIQLDQHQEYRTRALAAHYSRVPIPARRGSILDAKGVVLAQTLEAFDLRIDGKLAWEKPETFHLLAQAMGCPAEDLRKQVSPRNRYQLLIPDLTTDEAESFKRLKLQSLILVRHMKRVYPGGHEASHILGFVNRVHSTDGGQNLEREKGMAGVEQLMDAVLQGHPGERLVVRDGSRKRREIAVYRIQDVPPQNGLSVMLTIDQGIQHVIEEEADRLVHEHNPHWLSIIVTNPQTGAILGLTNRPTFDPNLRATLTEENMRNRAIADMIEPGSTFKWFVYAAALNERVVTRDSLIFCENGHFVFNGRTIRDLHPTPTVSLVDAFATSSNIASVKLALLVGEETFYEYIRRFGFGSRVQLNPKLSLPGEEPGILRPLNRWSRISVTSLPMGYEVAVTNLQMAMAVGAIANGGQLLEPMWVQAIVGTDGRRLKTFQPRAIRHVIRPEVAQDLRENFSPLVLMPGGTAASASVPGFVAGGKTGTSRIYSDGGYSQQYNASFVGFLPVDRPAFLVSIIVSAPQGGEIYGGRVAGPAFKRIAQEVAQHLNLIPSGRAPVELVDRRTM